jgi:hypothetical protein
MLCCLYWVILEERLSVCVLASAVDDKYNNALDVISTQWCSLSLSSSFECPCGNFLTKLWMTVWNKRFSPYTGSISLWIAWAKCLFPHNKWTTTCYSCSTVAICNRSRYRCHMCNQRGLWNHLGISLPPAVANSNPFLTYRLCCIHLWLTDLPDSPIWDWGSFPWAKWPIMKLITHLHQILQLRVTGSMYLLSGMPLWPEETTIPSRYTIGTMLWVDGSSVQNLVANCGACVCARACM